MMATSSVWSTLKNEIEFLKEYPMLSKATADNATPIPGYLFGEINALTFINNGSHSKQLINFMLSRLQGDSPQVKMKVLKLILYLIKNGHQNIPEELRNNEVILKQVSGTSGPPDPLHGNTFYVNIRDMSKEVLDIIFSEENLPSVLPKNVPSKSSTSDGISKMTGYGSSASSKKMQGFGNTVQNSKTMGERVADGLTNFMDKVLTSGSGHESNKAQKMILEESLPKYKPLTVERSSIHEILESDASEAPSLQEGSHELKSMQRVKKVHRIGRAGGGWDEEEEEEETEESTENVQKNIHTVPPSHTSNQSTISVDSLDKSELVPCSEWVEEHKAVNDFSIDEPLEELNWKDIASLCKRCAILNCDKVLEFIVEKLNTEEKEYPKMRALILMESLIYNDVLTVESLIKIAVPALQKLAQSKEDPVRIKAKKISLIIECFSKMQRQGHARMRNSSAENAIIVSATKICKKEE